MTRTIVAIAAILFLATAAYAQDSLPPQHVVTPPAGATAPGAPATPTPPATTPVPSPPPLVIPAPPPAIPAPPQVMPFPKLPSVTLDMDGDSLGIAQQTAHAKGYQARLLWVDATANLGDINSVAKIHAIVTKAVQTGFNTIVLDVKPLIGYTIYPSQFAPKLLDWNNGAATMPATFDPLAAFVTECHAAGVDIVANVAPFGEGHKYFDRGPGYTNPAWQTILYEPDRTVRAPVLFSPSYTIDNTPNEIPADPNTLGNFTDPDMLHKPIPGAMADVVDFAGRVIAQANGDGLASVVISVPPQGAVLVGKGPAGEFLRNTTHVGDTLLYQTTPQYVPIAQADEQKITLFANPNNPDVQQHELDIINEIVTKYPVDGIICDDRTRYAAINADFSDITRAQFEQYVGHPIKWPDDVFRYSDYPNQEFIKGPEYEAWLVFRALTIRNWVARAQAVVKAIRPNATFSVYVGSWYGDYDGNGENWAAPDANVGFNFETPSFMKTGFADLLDWMTTGCYYKDATIDEGRRAGDAGATVEAAGQLSNRLANDQTWVYAGLYAAQFADSPDQFGKCLQAAAASSQGIMVFDRSQVEQYNLWPELALAFAVPATAPHKIAGLLDSVRTQHAAEPPPQSTGETVLPGKTGTGL